MLLDCQTILSKSKTLLSLVWEAEAERKAGRVGTNAEREVLCSVAAASYAKP